MKIAVGADHAGYALKERLLEKLRSEGYEIVDFGTHSTDSTDYPDYTAAVSHAVAKGEAEKGLLVCASGIGMSIAANKVQGIRAALGTNLEQVSYIRRHNDANVLTLGSKYTDEPSAEQMLSAFLTTGFEGGRHQCRLDKIQKLEQEGIR